VTVLAHLRSLLFAPGSDERKLTRALASGADAVVADLEDAVAPAEKAAARALVARVLGEPAGGCARVVRINGTDTELWEDDLAAIEDLGLDAVMLPKATPEAVRALGSSGPPVIAIVETAIGLRLAYETACEPRVAALALGAADLGTELRLEPRADGQELLFARSSLVVDSAAAGIQAPLDVVHLDTRDDAGLEQESDLARSLGFGGKLCIHPAQVEIVNRAFAPTDEQLVWARAAVDAYEEGLAAGRGAVSLDGEMIDAPVVERARAILQHGTRETRESA
jgi:citrate lyase subunit beta/citryl-CoA lyase